RFAEIRKLPAEPERLAKIDEIVNWANPGPGGFYDDLGDMTRQTHLVLGEDFEHDPDFLRSPMVGVGARTPQDGWRTSWWSDAESMFESPLRMRYTGLDPNARYKVKVVYGGDNFRT